jgi:hypothetical protein
MSFDRSKLYIYRGTSGYYVTCTDCRGEANHSMSAGRTNGEFVRDRIINVGRENSQLTADAIERGFIRHINYHAEQDVAEKAPLDDPVGQLQEDLKAVVDGVVKEYGPKVQKVLTDFGLKHLLK